MYRKYVYSQTTWFDIVSADTSELVEIANLYSLDKDVVKNIANDTGVSTVEHFNDGVYISLFVPCIQNERGKEVVSHKRICFVLGSNFVITSRFNDIQGFKQAKKTLKNNPV